MSRSTETRKDHHWNVLDKIIQAAMVVHKLFPADDITTNSTNMTILLSDYSECGYNEAVHEELFRRGNSTKIDGLEGLGLLFENRKEKWFEKKLTLPHSAEPPLIYDLFVLKPERERAARNAAGAGIGGQAPPPPMLPENAPPVPELQIVSIDKNKIVTKSRNNKIQEWHHIVGATEENDDFERFRHALTAAHTKEILKRLTGDTDIGVTLLVQLLHSTSPDACKLGMKRCGAGVFQQLTAEQTLALALGCGITSQARIYLNRFLSYFNNGFPVLANEADCAAVKYKHAVKPEFDTFTYTPEAKAAQPEEEAPEEEDQGAGPGAESGTPVSVEYWQKDLVQCVQSLLRGWRDEKIEEGKVKTLGQRQGTHAAVIERAGPIFKNVALRGANVAEGIDARIDEFLGQMRNLLQVFWAINELMEQTSQLSAQELDLFENLCKAFGRMWRVYFKDGIGGKKMSITPKLHQLESHLPAQMRLFGCIGDKSEAAVERLHHKGNKTGRQLAAVPTWHGRKSIQIEREDKVRVQAVIEAGEEVMLGTKRRFKAPAVARKMAKNTAKVEERSDRLISAGNCAIAFELAHPVV